jgi:hypothetical protein
MQKSITTRAGFVSFRFVSECLGEMSPKYVPAPFQIQIYRDIYYDYEKGTAVAATNAYRNCKCACTNTCNGVDRLLYFAHAPQSSPAKTKDDDEPKPSSACDLCRSITTALQSGTFLADMKFNPTYDTKYNASQTAILQRISDIETKQQQFELNRKKISSLQSRIRLAHELLNAQATKLKLIGSTFSNLKAQTSEKHLDRVALRFPYAQPFYTMSSRNYMLLIICFNVCLVVVILVYGFRQRTTLVADMAGAVASPPQPQLPQPPPESYPDAPARNTPDERDFDEW